jgi:hypothetical protein
MFPTTKIMKKKTTHHTAFVVIDRGAGEQLFCFAFFFFFLADAFATGVFLSLDFQLSQILSTVRALPGLTADVTSTIEARFQFTSSQ